LIWHFSRKKNSAQINSETKTDSSDEITHISYDTLDEWKADLKTLWQGSPLKIEFTYESRRERKRRIITLKKVAKNSRNELFLIGICHDKNQERTFNIENVTTMIKYKSKRYTHFDFLQEIVSIDATGYAFFC
jgi:hypothetical protein